MSAKPVQSRDGDLRPGSADARSVRCLCPRMDNEELDGLRNERSEDPCVAVVRCPLHGQIFKRRMTPERMGGAGLRVFDAIAREWGLTLAEQLGLLRVPEPTFTAWRQAALAGQDVAVGGATLERLSHLVGISRELGVLLPASHAGWVRRPNSNSLFGGKPALNLMIGDPDGVAAVWRHLHSWHGGWG